MNKKITIEHKVTIAGKGSFSAQHNILVDAVDTVNISIAEMDGSATTATVEVQPGSRVECVFIKSSTYDKDLTFDVAGTGATALDGPVVLSGSGPVSLLQSDPTTIEFSNSLSKSVDIEIITCRAAIV